MNAIAPIAPAEIALPRYDDMCRAIAECHAIDDAKEIQSRAEALRAYTRQLHNRELEVQFAEIRLRAERRVGELLDELQRNGIRASSGDRSGKRPTLKSFGITQMAASRARVMAAVPAPKFEEALKAARESMTPASSRKLRSLVKESETNSNQRQRALHAIETLSEIAITPEQFVMTMDAEARARLLLALSCAVPWIARVFGKLQ